MELQELKNIWNEHDKNLDTHVQVNQQLLKRVSLDKARSLMGNFKFSNIIELIASAIWLWPMAYFMANHYAEPKFMIPALILFLIAVLTMAWNVYSLVTVWQLNLDMPITRIQKKLEKMNLYNNLFHRNLLFLLMPLVYLTFMIVAAKGLLGIDMYQHWNFMLPQIIGCILLAPVIIWMLKKFPDRKLEEALRFLKEIRKFEKEDQ